MRKIIFILICVFIVAGFSYSFYSYGKIKIDVQPADKFYKDLIEAVNMKKNFKMSDVTDVDWDEMIVFYPYTSRDEMFDMVGHDWTYHSYLGYVMLQKTFLGDYPLDDDSLNKVVFIKGDRVILDVTFNTKDVDLTEIEQRIMKEDAWFSIRDRRLILLDALGQ